jgi:hypothetical protein
VDRLDEAVQNPKTDGESATSRNQAVTGQVGEERFLVEVLEKTGAGDLD